MIQQEDGQESDSAHGAYENIKFQNIYPIPLIYLMSTFLFFILTTSNACPMN